MLSDTYVKMVLIDPATILILGRVSCILPLSRYLPKTSAIMMYKKGEKRHPCLIPLGCTKKPNILVIYKGGNPKRICARFEETNNPFRDYSFENE